MQLHSQLQCGCSAVAVLAVAVHLQLVAVSCSAVAISCSQLQSCALAISCSQLQSVVVRLQYLQSVAVQLQCSCSQLTRLLVPPFWFCSCYSTRREFDHGSHCCLQSKQASPPPPAQHQTTYTPESVACVDAGPSTSDIDNLSSEFESLSTNACVTTFSSC